MSACVLSMIVTKRGNKVSQPKCPKFLRACFLRHKVGFGYPGTILMSISTKKGIREEHI